MTVDIEKSPQLNGAAKAKDRRQRDIVEAVGGNGPWQCRIFLVAMFVAIPSAAHNLVMTFYAPNQDHWCARTTEALRSNVSVQAWKTIGLPPGRERCFRYKEVNWTLVQLSEWNRTEQDEDNVVACNSWEYDESFYTSTVLSQWDLVCHREWLVSFSKSIYMVGFLVSLVVFGHIADKLGRRPVVTVNAAISVCAAVICAFSTSFIVFAVSRFFVAIGLAGMFNTMFVLLMEVLGPGMRATYGVAVEFGWCVGFLSLPAIVWLLRDWFWIQLAITAPCLVLLPIYWMIPESPRWLISQGRLDEARKVLIKAAERNGKKAEDVEETLCTFSEKMQLSDEKTGNFLDLIRTPGLWQKTLNIFFCWFVNAFVYYGLSYNTNDLAGNPFVNFAISGAVEIPGYVISIVVIRTLGRRNPVAAAMAIGGAACIITALMPINPWWLSVGVSMLGKFCITCSFGVIFVYTAEIFPTVVRNIGLGSASTFARVASIVAPFVRELGNATYAILPFLMYGLLAALGGVLVLLLPETKNSAIPDTISEAAERKRKPMKNGIKNVSNGYPVVMVVPSEEPTTTDDVLRPKSPKVQDHAKKLADVEEEDVADLQEEEQEEEESHEMADMASVVVTEATSCDEPPPPPVLEESEEAGQPEDISMPPVGEDTESKDKTEL